MRLRLVGIVAVSALALAACGSSSSAGSTSGSPEPTKSGTGRLTVFAAASLKEAFTAIGKDFEATYPGMAVTFNFGPSSTLATQIVEGAPADVFASASTATMNTAVQAGAASNPTTFAVNAMAIATPTAPTTTVRSLADLAKPDIKVAVCQAAVPCGAAAQKLFTQNNLTVTPTSQEVDVKAVLSKVQLGEVDAGIVYVTDVKAAKGTVVGVTIPAGQNVTTEYPIAPVTGSSNDPWASAFIDLVMSPAGQKVLSDAGFGPA